MPLLCECTGVDAASVAGTTVSMYVDAVEADKKAVERHISDLKLELDGKRKELIKSTTKRIDAEFADAKASVIAGFKAFSKFGIFTNCTVTTQIELRDYDGAKDFLVRVYIGMSNDTIGASLELPYTKLEIEIVKDIIDLEVSIDKASDELVKIRERLSPGRIQQLRDKTVAGITMQQLDTFRGGNKLKQMIADIVSFQQKQDGKVLCLEHKKSK